jgi:hypothetical protein
MLGSIRAGIAELGCGYGSVTKRAGEREGKSEQAAARNCWHRIILFRVPLSVADLE